MNIYEQAIISAARALCVARGPGNPYVMGTPEDALWCATRELQKMEGRREILGTGGPIDSRGQPIIEPIEDEGLLVPDDYEVHMAHCNQFAYRGVCKYGDPDCPAMKLDIVRPALHNFGFTGEADEGPVCGPNGCTPARRTE